MSIDLRDPWKEHPVGYLFFLSILFLVIIGAIYLALPSDNDSVYRSANEQKAFFEGYDVGYREGYDAAKHNLSYGVVWEKFNFTCAEGKNYSEQANRCITD